MVQVWGVAFKVESYVTMISNVDKHHKQHVESNMEIGVVWDVRDFNFSFLVT